MMTSSGYNGTGAVPLQGEIDHFTFKLDVTKLNAAKLAVLAEIENVPAFFLGLGSDAKSNLGLRKRLNQPGAPFGGIGFFEPQQGSDGAPEGEIPPPEVTADFVRSAKLKHFEACTAGGPSMYVWAVQPIYDVDDRICAGEILVRARNGTDSAPFEDLMAIMNPDAPEDVRKVYVDWKAYEIVDWTLQVLKRHSRIAALFSISTNIRPFDLLPTSAVFQKVAERVAQLSPADYQLLKRCIVIEVTEDQKAPEDESACLKAWKDLGFKVAYDDAIGVLALEALGKQGCNFHTIEALEPVLDCYNYVKVDIEWAGFCLFLSHPSYAFDKVKKAEVLEKAKTEGMVYVPKGSALHNTGVKHMKLLEEFAKWALRVVALRKPIVIELSVTPKDESHAYVLEKLKDEFELDIFGTHKSLFYFQGGPTAAKAFEPAVLDSAICEDSDPVNADRILQEYPPEVGDPSQPKQGEVFVATLAEQEDILPHDVASPVGCIIS